MSSQSSAYRPASSRWTVLIPGVSIQLLLVAVYWSFTSDDAYITARYASNLAGGNGLVFNIGERVNALTSPLHALLSALFIKLGLPGVVGNKVVPVILVTATLSLMVGRAWGDSFRSLLFSVTVFTSPLIVFWTVGGQETPYLLAAVTGTVFAYARAIRSGSTPSLLGLSLLSGLLFLLRHDTVLFATPLLAATLVKWPRRAVVVLAPPIITGGTWLLFAYRYYEDLLPTSFYTKTPQVGLPMLGQNVIYLIQFAVLSGVGILLFLWFQSSGEGDWGRRRRLASWGLLLAFTLIGIYSLLVGTVHMMFGYRLLVPYLPSALWILVDGLRPSSIRPSSGRKLKGPLLTAGGAIVVINLTVFLVIEFKTINPGVVGEYRQTSRREYVHEFSEALERGAEDIRTHWEKVGVKASRAPRMATFAVGLIPYRLGEFYVFDTHQQLISFRKRCQAAVRRLADYIHFPGSELSLLARHLIPHGDYQLVSQQVLDFEGSEASFLVYYNPMPLPGALPGRVDEACDGLTSPGAVLGEKSLDR